MTRFAYLPEDFYARLLARQYAVLSQILGEHPSWTDEDEVEDARRRLEDVTGNAVQEPCSVCLGSGEGRRLRRGFVVAVTCQACGGPGYITPYEPEVDLEAFV